MSCEWKKVDRTIEDRVLYMSMVYVPHTIGN